MSYRASLIGCRFVSFCQVDPILVEIQIFALSATGVPLMHRMELWVDGARKYQQLTRAYSHAAFLDTTLTLPAGTHRVTVFAAGQDNSLQSKTYNIIVK